MSEKFDHEKMKAAFEKAVDLVGQEEAERVLVECFKDALKQEYENVKNNDRLSE